jgi:hypothetical protein
VIVNGPYILLIDLETCNELNQYIKVDRIVIGATLSTNGQQLVYAEKQVSPQSIDYLIRSLDLNSGQVVDLSQGINPALSPDNQQIAYTGTDGIYIMMSDGSVVRQM